MTRARRQATVFAAILVAALLACSGSAGAAALRPPPGQDFFGVTDTGVSSQFVEFSEAVGKHPALIETFGAWGKSLAGSVKRWQKAEARPVLHISTADPSDGHELIDPQQIADGFGDDYLIELNQLFWSTGMRAYIRPLGEPNRCLNAYAAYDCGGHPRGAEHSPYWYREAFRRMYIVLHGGGTLATIDQRLRVGGLPPLRNGSKPLPESLPQAPIAVLWSPLPVGSPNVRGNRPERFYPGRAYTDWSGSDFYSGATNWHALTQLYNRYRGQPFALTEWGVDRGDNPNYVKRLFVWVKRHPRTRMLVYYQDFGTSNPYRIQNYPASLGVLRRRVAGPEFPPFALDPPQPVPPAPAKARP